MAVSPLGFPLADAASDSGFLLTYSTYVGGSGEDIAKAIATDAQGNVYVSVSTTSADIQINPGQP
ncbi:MAG: SBBP repeat-containing protein [Acidobacteriota bacterium]|nr:SBBP repeat-containing protein [Acidobacteriota bacterium]